MKKTALWIAYLALAACGAPGASGQAASGGAGGGRTTSSAGDTGQPTGPEGTLTSSTGQIVVVIATDWASVPATLTRYQAAAHGVWAQVGSSFPVVLGNAGLGWGNGLHPSVAPAGAPVKHEGDGRSPAGLFTVETAFGYAPASTSTWVKIAYLQATNDLNCVDDPNSQYYTRTLYESSLPQAGPQAPDWNSSEIMLRPDDLYEIGAIVDHNTRDTVKGGGSCIFLHVWEGPGSSTVGCTAMDVANLHDVLAWLDPAASPLVVQLPQATYDAVKTAWGLP